jgi:hypothetical protein
MAERRSLIEGVKSSRAVEEQFIYAGKPKAGEAKVQPPHNAEPVAVKPTPQTSRVPFTTRVRSDIAHALKRASLERQLQSVEPNTVQDILEAALEPWLKTNGYLQ